MQIKNLTLGLGIVLASSALAQQTYKVRNGDCDWTIARKFDTTVRKLHQANPKIDDWDAVQNGAVLRIPGTSSSGSHSSKVSVSSKHHSSVSTHSSSSHTTVSFKVSGDDNDWIIAHHLGVPIHMLHELNPGVDWNRLRPGKHILVPSDGSHETRVAKLGTKSGKIKVNRIRGRYAVVNTESVSIRREAGQHADRITTVGTGTKVVVLDRDGAWYKLRFPKGTEGWIRGDFLNASKAPTSSHRRRHNDDEGETRVAHRSTPSRHHTPEAVVSLDGEAKINPIIKSATAMRGTRYSYGSSSRSGTDCSGFTWQVYGSHGIHLPRTSNEQSHVGQPITQGHLKPGDLVFFSGRRGGRQVGHVGIYVGKDKFIHASSGGGKVQYNSLHDAYYANHYKGARRVAQTSHKSKSSPEHKAKPVAVAAEPVDTDPTPVGG